MLRFRANKLHKPAALLALAACIAAASAAAPLPAPPERRAEIAWLRGDYDQAAALAAEALAADSANQAAMAVAAVCAHRNGSERSARQLYLRFCRASAADNEPPLIASCAAELMWLVNEERRQGGLQLLLPSDLLCSIAADYSAKMRDLGFFDHFAPARSGVPRTPVDRIRARTRRRLRLVAENLAHMACSNTYALSLKNVRRSHQQLMASPGHRSNILLRDATHLGIGIAVNSRGDYWITELFVRWAD